MPLLFGSWRSVCRYGGKCQGGTVVKWQGGRIFRYFLNILMALDYDEQSTLRFLYQRPPAY